MCARVRVVTVVWPPVCPQVDLLEEEKRKWAETIPERMWAIQGRTVFNFLDQDADGLIGRLVGPLPHARWVVNVCVCLHAGTIWRRPLQQRTCWWTPHTSTRCVCPCSRPWFVCVTPCVCVCVCLQCYHALGMLRQDLNALRLPPELQQVYCGFNVPLHLQPCAPSGLESDAAYREIFENAVTNLGVVPEPVNPLKRKLERAMRAAVCKPPIFHHREVRGWVCVCVCMLCCVCGCLWMLCIVW